MSMGKRKRDRQPAMWVTATNLPTAASHPFDRPERDLSPRAVVDESGEVTSKLLSCGSRQNLGLYRERYRGADRGAGELAGRAPGPANLRCR